MKRHLLAAAVAVFGMTQAAQATVVDAFDLNVSRAAPTFSSILLTAGHRYAVTLSGTFLIAGRSPARLADAEYYQLARTFAWADLRQSTDIGVQLNGADVAWGPFNAAHVYTTELIGTGHRIGLAFVDANAGSYGDNIGSLRVSVAAVPLPATGLALLLGLGGLIALRRSKTA